jgi:hypothetical protein
MMPHDLFSADDIRQIMAHGLTEAQVMEQIQWLIRGATPLRLNRPCTVGDGMVSIPEAELEGLVKRHDQGAGRGRVMKFVPASGAASRMFEDWFRYLDGGCFDTAAAAHAFAGDIRKYAFYEDLERLVGQRGESLAAWIEQGRTHDILAAILTAGGLNYASLPKALLKFHHYPEGSRTALEEHLVEAALYAKDRKQICKVYFTVSEEHRHDVETHLSGIRKRYEEQYNVRFEIDVSVQSAPTDTIAVDLQNCPLRDEAGKLVLRPGGHGALLSNLNQFLAGDIVFLKNIDNIVPDHLKPPTVLYKKVLSGYLLMLQEQIFRYLDRMAEGDVPKRDLEILVSFCEEKLHIIFPAWFTALPHTDKQAFLVSKLNRPIRICGMVKNEGEPGGGPFWVDEADGTQSLQIIEGFQIDRRSEGQRLIWSAATHFNPVDLVCGVRDYRYRKFDLNRFVNQKAFSVTEKSERGRDLKALELPGLWNGSMHDWTTIFVETPIETFNPVKTIHDLLRPQHCAPLSSN